MGKQEFERTAGAITLNLGGSTVVGKPKLFATGSCGWNFNGKAEVTLPNGDVVRVQVSGNAIAIGSKDW